MLFVVVVVVVVVDDDDDDDDDNDDDEDTSLTLKITSFRPNAVDSFSYSESNCSAQYLHDAMVIISVIRKLRSYSHVT